MRLKPPQFLRLRKQASVRSPDEAQQTAQKKSNKHKAFIAAVAVITVLILGAIPVTYSYLTASSETVINTFAGGAISLTLDEAKVDTDGNPLDGELRVQENTYKVIPGETLYKDPTVTVLEGSEVCYVYLYVENQLDEDYFTLNYSEDWIQIATTGTRTLYVYKTIVDASEGDVKLTPIFTTVAVSGELTGEQIEAMGEVMVNVQAYAIQAEGVDLATATQMAADYFEAEFDFDWTNVDTAVDIDGLITEDDSEDTQEADTFSDTADEESTSDEADTADTEAFDEASDETDTAGTEASDEASDETDTADSSFSDEAAGSTDTSAEEYGSTTSEESSSDSSESAGSDAGTDSSDSSGNAATLDIVE